MDKKKKVYLYLLVLIIIFISFSFIQAKNIFWGFKDKIKEKSGIEEKVIKALLKTEEFLPVITYPPEGSIVNASITVKGRISKEIDYIELKLDDGKWQKIIQKPDWSITFNEMSMAEHTIYVHAVEKEIKGPDISVNFIVSLVPTGVAASDGTYIDKIRITWNNVSGAEKYYIYCSTISNGSYNEIGNTTSNNYDDNNASMNILYYYKIRAYNSASGYSEYSEIDSGYWEFLPPSLVSASDIFHTHIQVFWSTVSNAELYYIYRSTNIVGTYVEIAQTNWMVYNDYSAGVNTNYYYKIKAYSSAGGFSGFSSFALGIRSFSSPTNVNASDGALFTKVRITWNSVPNAEKYYIYRSTVSNGSYTEIGNTNTTLYEDSTAGVNTNYYYKIKAYSSSAEYSEYSSIDKGYWEFLPPTGISASDGIYFEKVNISWNPAANSEKYYIYRSTTSNGVYSEIGNTNITFYNDYTALKDNTYYYKIKSYSSIVGYSVYSSWNYGHWDFLPPSNVLASDGNYTNKVQITWNNVPGAEKYYIYRSKISNGTYTEIGNTNIFSFDDTAVLILTNYYYKIKVYTSSLGYSDYSIWDNGFITYVGPSNVIASDGDYTDKVIITWNSDQRQLKIH